MEILLYIGAFFGFMAWMMVLPLAGRIGALKKEVAELRSMVEADGPGG